MLAAERIAAGIAGGSRGMCSARRRSPRCRSPRPRAAPLRTLVMLRCGTGVWSTVGHDCSVRGGAAARVAGGVRLDHLELRARELGVHEKQSSHTLAVLYMKSGSRR